MPKPPAIDQFADKRAAMREEFFGKLFVLGGFVGATDTYKRTMWSAVPDFAVDSLSLVNPCRKPRDARNVRPRFPPTPRRDCAPRACCKRD